MKQYCPNLAKFFNYEFDSLYTDTNEPIYRSVNQILANYLEENEPEGLISDIKQLMADYDNPEELKAKLSDLGMRINVINKE